MPFDHSFGAQVDHALDIDFVNSEMGLDTRVAVELSPDSAHRLTEEMGTVLDRGKVEAGLESHWP